ncbi:MAG: hypothetical protein ACHQ51_08780 [Elusimicrobiota bacterium]
MRTRALGIFVLFAAFLAACSPPKYARYHSVSGDFSVEVPWGWNVIAEADHDSFSEVKFIGPFDADFFMGAPSLSVRWFKRYRAHALRTGAIEMYSDSDDFINQMLRQVYGPGSIILVGGKLLDKTRPIPEVTLRESGLPAKYFAVLSPAPAAAGTVGAVRDTEGNWHNIRYHEYVVIPMAGGFYVLTYPATQRAHDKAVDRFNAMAASFHPYTNGPGGEKITLRPAAAAKP